MTEKTIQQKVLDFLKVIIKQDPEFIKNTNPAVFNKAKEIRSKAAEIYYSNTNDKTLLLSDHNYDVLEKWLIRAGEPRIIGATPILGTGEHLANHEHWFENLLGSLDKETDFSVVKEKFAKNKLVKSGTVNNIYYLSPKFDGGSLCLTYSLVDGRLLDATTRGKDGKGKDLRRSFNTTRLSDEFISDFGGEGKVAIKFEATVRWDMLQVLNKSENQSYKSGRSAANAITAPKNVGLIKYGTFRPLDFVASEAKWCESITDSYHGRNTFLFEHLANAIEGINIEFFMPVTVNKIEQIEKFYTGIREKSENQLDGIVIAGETTSETWTGGYPDYMVAVKFPTMTEMTVVTGFSIENGSVGNRITPMVHFKPVNLNGHEYTKTAILSHKRWKELVEAGLGIGCDVKFSLNGDVMGYITIEKTDNVTEIAKLPDFCPICAAPLEENESGNLLMCVNPDCDNNIVGKASTFIKRIGIKGVREATLEKIIESELYNNPLTFIKWALNASRSISELIDANITGISKKTIENIVLPLESKLIRNPIKDYLIFSALAIPGLDASRFQDFFRVINYSDTFGEIFANDGLNWKYNMTKTITHIIDADIVGWGEGLKNTLTNWLSHKNNIILLRSIIMNCNVESTYGAGNSELVGQSVCVTGSCKAMARKHLEAALKEMGVKVTGTVSAKTKYLITDDSASGSSKAQKAMQLGTQIISSAQALEIFQIAP